jgi:hypothetical protein
MLPSCKTKQSKVRLLSFPFRPQGLPKKTKTKKAVEE